MAEEFNSSKPIYLQVADKIYSAIVRGEIKSGEKLPSVRDTAVQMGVNPNTIQRTYAEMEREGVVETKRGQGTFVRENSDVVIALRNRIKSDIIQNFVQSMQEIGLSKEEMVQGVRQFLGEGEEHYDD
ncbi:GntR family transcriptional regulator [Bacillus sp. M6-12]|uniref:GntR family transcriptional regulator n=1 Tax=Bacillus sp. M6-12 TaxID=2054166 RepID=UPI000C770C18|nr:GntR family transcriptional regulator [Bacillus sp. M6-12]PLS15613.1 GntR family transcriptional regulator [Bacillus sp. M6-12]